MQRPRGVGAVRDHLAPSQMEEGPPSLFKMFLFEPIVQVIKWLLRGIFIVVDFLRKAAFAETAPIAAPAADRNAFLKQLQAAPSPQQILLQFEKIFSIDEQNQIYQMIGEVHPEKFSWKEILWKRGESQNIDLGRRLVRQNPFLLRDYF